MQIDGATALHIASQKGDVTCIKKLLASRANLDVTSTNGSTPLHAAAGEGRSHAVQMLVSAGASIDATDKVNGSTPLSKAIENGHTHTAKALLALGASVHNAAVGKHLPRIKIKFDFFLIAKAGGVTPLHIASLKGNTEVIGALLDAGASISKETDEGYTALLIARRFGHDDAASMLVVAQN